MDTKTLSSKTFQKAVRILAIITVAILTLTTSRKIIGLIQNDFYRSEPVNLLVLFYFPGESFPHTYSSVLLYYLGLHILK